MNTGRISVQRHTPLEPALAVADRRVIVRAIESERANHVLKANAWHEQIWQIEDLLRSIVVHHQPIIFIPQREAVRHAFDCVGDTSSRLLDQGLRFFKSLFASGDFAPRADHFDWLPTLVADEMPFIAYPAIAAILLEKPILDGVMTFLVEVDGLGFDLGEVIWMNTAAPEIGMLQILVRFVAPAKL